MPNGENPRFENEATAGAGVVPPPLPRIASAAGTAAAIGRIGSGSGSGLGSGSRIRLRLRIGCRSWTRSRLRRSRRDGARITGSRRIFLRLIGFVLVALVSPCAADMVGGILVAFVRRIACLREFLMRLAIKRRTDEVSEHIRSRRAVERDAVGRVAQPDAHGKLGRDTAERDVFVIAARACLTGGRTTVGKRCRSSRYRR